MSSRLSLTRAGVTSAVWGAEPSAGRRTAPPPCSANYPDDFRLIL